MILGYKVWYADGSVVKTTNWAEVPDNGVQVVVKYLDNGRGIFVHHDYYYILDNRLQSSNEIPEGAQHIKLGKLIDPKDFEAIYQAALADTEF